MSVKGLVEEYTRKRQEAGRTKQYPELFRLMGEFSDRVKQLSKPEITIAQGLEEVSKEPCKEGAQLWIIAAQIHPSSKYLPYLCTILEQDDDCIWHEGIVDILYDLADEKSMSSLLKALEYDFSSDPTKELAVKILETLHKIGGPIAYQVLSKNLESPSSRIRDVAEMLLTDVK